MSALPEPTLQDLNDYEVFHDSPKYVVKYKETLMTLDPKHRIKKVKYYGYFTSKKNAQEHFFSLKPYYQWKSNRYVRQFIGIVALEQFVRNNKRKQK